jgi:hypothetical protein
LANFEENFVHQELQGLPKPLLSDKDGGMRGALDGERRDIHAESVLQPSSLAIFVEEQRKDQLNRYLTIRKDFVGKSYICCYHRFSHEALESRCITLP